MADDLTLEDFCARFKTKMLAVAALFIGLGL